MSMTSNLTTIFSNLDVKAVVDVHAACIITCFADIKRRGRSIGCLSLQKATRCNISNISNITPRMQVSCSGHVCTHVRQKDTYKSISQRRFIEENPRRQRKRACRMDCRTVRAKMHSFSSHFAACIDGAAWVGIMPCHVNRHGHE